MFNKKQTDVVVLGAGPVGLTAAHALANHDIDFVLFDREKGTNPHSYALALHPETIELLDRLGIAEPVLDQALRVDRVAVYDGNECRASVDYAGLPVNFPFLAVIGQNTLERTLEQTLTEKKNRPMWHHRVCGIEQDERQVTLEVDRLVEGMTGYAIAHIDTQVDKILNYKAEYLIGADGHDSRARKAAGIPFDELSPSAEYAVFEFRTDTPLPKEMRLMIDGDKTHVFWPLPGNHCRFSFQVDPDAAHPGSRTKDARPLSIDDEGYTILELSHLEELLHEHAPWFKGSTEDVEWRTVVRFEQRLADAFGKNRIWLAGESAHMSPPGGILGMNVGMHEAADLASRLAVPDEDRAAALASYNEERRAEWQRLFDIEHHLAALDGNDEWLEAHLAQLVGNIPATGDNYTALLKQLQLVESS